MRVLLGALVLMCCAWRTHDRALDWRSDEALWTSAARSAEALARPALNAAMATLRRAQWDAAAHWTQHAMTRMTPDDAWLIPRLCAHLNRLTVQAPDPPALSFAGCAW